MADEPQVTPTEPAATPAEPAPAQTPDQLAAAEEQRKAEEAERQEQEAIEKKPWFQKRFDQLTRQRYEAEERAKLAEEENARLKALADKYEQPKTKTQDTPSGKPVVDKFETYEDYLDALTDWKIEQRESKVSQQNAQKQAEEEQRRAQMTFNQKMAATVAAGRTKFPDWEKVVPGVPEQIMTRDIVAATVELEHSAEVSYFLATNLQETERISKLSPFAMAAELGKIEAKITTHKPKTTNAPPPVNPLGGASPASGEIDPEKNPIEWIKARNEGRI